MSAYPPPPSTLPSPASLQKARDGARPNPEYIQLYEAYRKAYGQAPELEKALDAPTRTAGDAWVGPAARKWERDLQDERARLKQAASQILWDIYGALSKIPPSLPQ